MKKSPYVGRVVAVAAAVCSLILAVLPVVANMDWRSTAGVLAGIAGVVAIAQKWLTGLQAHEARLPAPPTIAASSGGLYSKAGQNYGVTYTAGGTAAVAPADPEFTPDPNPPSGPDPSAAQSALDGATT